MSTLNLPISKIIDLIKSNRQLRSTIIEKHENITEDIFNVVEKPNCGVCISKIETFINQNIDFINNIVKEIQTVPPAPEKAPSPIVEKTPFVQPTVTKQPQPLVLTPVRVAGEVYEIDADPAQYKELIELSQSQRWTFRGLDILEKTNSDGKKVWMVFFF